MQHVVEVMRDTASQPTNRLHLLALTQGLFRLATFRRLGTQRFQGLSQIAGPGRYQPLEFFVSAGKHFTGSHLVVNVSRGPQPFDNATLLVAYRDTSTLKPAVNSVSRTANAIVGAETAQSLGFGPGGQCCLPVIRMNGIKPA